MRKTLLTIIAFTVLAVSAFAVNEVFKIGTIDCTSGDQQIISCYFGYAAIAGDAAPTGGGWSVWIYDHTDGVSQPTGILTMYLLPFSARGTVPYRTAEQIPIFTAVDLSNIDTANGIDFGEAVGDLMKSFGFNLYCTMTTPGNNSVTVEVVRDTE